MPREWSGGWSVSVASVQARLLDILERDLEPPGCSSRLGENPLVAHFRPPLPARARLYTFVAKTMIPNIGRRSEARYISIAHGSGEPLAKNRFDWSDAHMVYLLGWVPDFDVWIVFDAAVQEGPHGYRYNKTCYVESEAVVEAAINGLMTRRKRLRKPSRTEIAILATSSRLGDALVMRFEAHIGKLSLD